MIIEVIEFFFQDIQMVTLILSSSAKYIGKFNKILMIVLLLNFIKVKNDEYHSPQMTVLNRKIYHSLHDCCD